VAGKQQRSEYTTGIYNNKTLSRKQQQQKQQQQQQQHQ